MIKRVISFSLLIVAITLFIAFYTEDTFLLYNEAYSAKVAVYIGKSEFRFLSDEYFYELDSLCEQINKENDQWYVSNSSKKIAAKAVIDKMMDDLENDPDYLVNHKNFYRFFETFDKNIRQLSDITERMHFFRNTLNSYSGAPVVIKDMIDLAAKGEWYLFSAKFHRFNYEDINGALNVKFLSADGRFEAVYNTGTGKMVTDPANLGTYNYAPGSINPIEFYFHDKYDKRPWRKWGNVKGFSYDDIMNLESGHGTDEATNNDHEVNLLIQQRKAKLGK